MPPELQRIVRLTSFAEEERRRPALRYGLSRPAAERVAAVEYLEAGQWIWRPTSTSSSDS
jgi:hypothetical protein